jgi:hypothetical protein
VAQRRIRRRLRLLPDRHRHKLPGQSPIPAQMPSRSLPLVVHSGQLPAAAVMKPTDKLFWPAASPNPRAM